MVLGVFVRIQNPPLPSSTEPARVAARRFEKHQV